MNQAELEKVFGQPISVYTDREAIEDGILVPVTIDDRATRNVWEWLHQNTPLGPEPPASWPVPMMGWFNTGSFTPAQAQKMIATYGLEAERHYEKQLRDKKALALARGLIDRDRAKAKRIYAENIGGGIHVVYAYAPGGKITHLREQQLVDDDVKLWLLPNELGGITLMFPEDY